MLASAERVKPTADFLRNILLDRGIIDKIQTALKEPELFNVEAINEEKVDHTLIGALHESIIEKDYKTLKTVVSMWTNYNGDNVIVKLIS